MFINKQNLESPARFFYKQICKDNLQGAKDTYCTLYSAIQKHQSKIYILWGEEEQEDRDILNRFLFKVLGDNPEIFYLNWDNALYRFHEAVVEVGFKYAFSRSECQKLQKKITKKVLWLVQSAKGFYEKDIRQQIKYMYTYFATNISYAADKLKSKDEKTVCSIHTAVGALVNGEAVCDGISKAFKLILDELGIENRIIYRDIWKDKEYAHVWNVIKINGEELHVDVTWEIGLYSMRKYVSYECFWLTEDEMQKKHQGK